MPKLVLFGIDFLILPFISAFQIMRQRYLFLMFVLLAAFGCQHRSPIETLADVMPTFAEVYDLKDYHPDSAMRIMQDIVDTLDESELRRRSPFLFNEYQVLKTEIRYKNYIHVPNDTLTLKAYAFYDSVISRSRAAARDKVLFYQFTRSLYYKATVESHQGLMEVSFADYLRALGAMDGLTGNRQAFHFKKPNPEYEHFIALIYDRLAWFFYTYDEWDEALNCLKLSNECFEKEGSPKGVASNFELMGDVMLAQGDRYASHVYYNKSDSIFESLGINNIFQQYSMFFHDALELFNDNKKEECSNLLIKALQQSDDGSRIAKQIHFTLGFVYFEGQYFDSALYHYERSYPLLPRQTLKSYCNIIEAANALGDTTKAAQYGQLLAELTLERFYQQTEKAKMTALFEKYKDEKDTAIDRSMFLYVIGFVVLMAVTIACQTLWIYRRRRRSKADLEQHERIKSLLEQKIAQTNAEVKLKEEKISVLQLELEKAIANPDFQKLPFSEKLDVLTRMPISKRALKVLEYNVKAGVSYPELVMSENQMGQLVNAVDAVFPKFSVRMIEQYPRMKRSDVMYCCFYVLGLSEIQAAVLTGKTYQAVWKRSSKLHEIFGNKSDIQFILHGILKNW